MLYISSRTGCIFCFLSFSLLLQPVCPLVQVGPVGRRLLPLLHLACVVLTKDEFSSLSNVKCGKTFELKVNTDKNQTFKE